MMNSTEKLAKLLRTSEEVILNLEQKMSKVSDKQGIVDKIVKENNEKVEQMLRQLFSENKKPYKAEEVFQALIEKTRQTDQLLFKHFNYSGSIKQGNQGLISAVKELTGQPSGFYLKKEKAAELLKLNPPKNIISALGYENIDDLLKKEDVFEIFCALRFVEDENWLNDVFFRPYRDLMKTDFEQREIKIMVLPERWQGIGERFLGEKLHHMSHLKELGVVFIIPVSRQAAGEVLYLFFMTLHYLYEVDWHSRLFERYGAESDFAGKLAETLKVEVSEAVLPNGEKMSWRLAPKYLAKHNTEDPRLFEPHISPEAWFYAKTGRAIAEFSRKFPELGLGFWLDSDAAGEWFELEKTLVSFDMFDNGISLLKQAGFDSKYLYHQQEALWNKIFIEYIGEEELDKALADNLDKGFVVF